MKIVVIYYAIFAAKFLPGSEVQNHPQYDLNRTKHRQDMQQHIMNSCVLYSLWCKWYPVSTSCTYYWSGNSCSRDTQYTLIYWMFLKKFLMQDISISITDRGCRRPLRLIRYYRITINQSKWALVMPQYMRLNQLLSKYSLEANQNMTGCIRHRN